MNLFINEFMRILKSLERKNAEVIITGDLNIDLLKIIEKIPFSDHEFFNMITEKSFFPKMTLPTIFSNKHGTLIDNIFLQINKRDIKHNLWYTDKKSLTTNHTLHF